MKGGLGGRCTIENNSPCIIHISLSIRRCDDKLLIIVDGGLL